MFSVELELNLLDDDKELSDFFKCMVFHEIGFKVVSKDRDISIDAQDKVLNNPPTVKFTCRDRIGLVILITQGWGNEPSLIEKIRENEYVV